MDSDDLFGWEDETNKGSSGTSSQSSSGGTSSDDLFDWDDSAVSTDGDDWGFGNTSTPSNNTPKTDTQSESIDLFSMDESTNDDLFADFKPAQTSTPAVRSNTQATQTVQNNGNMVTNQTPVKQKKPLGMKAVGVLIGGGAIVLALILFIVSKIKVESNPDQQPIQITSAPSAQEPAQTTPAIQVDIYDGYSFFPDDVPELKGTFSTTHQDEIVQETVGTIKNKRVFKLSNENESISQLLCQLDINVTIGAKNILVHFMVTRAVWETVQEGEKLTVEYVVPADDYVLITKIQTVE